MATRSEIESLVTLLDDPDEFIRSSVIDRFENLGQGSVPLLDEIRVSTTDSVKRQQINDMILKLTFPTIELEFLNHVETGVTSIQELEQAVLILSRVDLPTIREELYTRQLNRMAHEIEAEVNYTLQPLAQMQIVIEHIFHRHRFKPAKNELFDATSVHLHKALESSQGIPLTLSMIVLFIARRLELPFHGVNMPVHFLMRYDFDSQVIYLDPYNQGKPLSLDDCLSFLKRNNIRPEQSYFDPAKPADMLLRNMRNLQNSYIHTGDAIRQRCMEILITHYEHLI
jgi:regulator of sirC expression with transglutaminase-like and TPR domain